MNNFLIRRISKNGFLIGSFMVILGLCFSPIFGMFLIVTNHIADNIVNGVGVFIIFIFFILIMKRLRDVNVNTYFSIIIVLTVFFINYIPAESTWGISLLLSVPPTIIFFALLPGTKGPNRFGPDPLDTSNQNGNVPFAANTPVVNEVINQPISQEGNSQPTAISTPPQV